MTIFPFMIVSCLVAAFGLSMGLGVGFIELLIYLIGLPIAMISEMFANRQYRKDMSLDAAGEAKVRYPFDTLTLFYVGALLVALIIGYVTSHFDLSCWLGLYCLIFIGYRQMFVRSSVREKLIYKSDMPEHGAVQVVNIINSRLYTIGFVNREFFEEFSRLNPESITRTFDRQELSSNPQYYLSEDI